MHFFKLLLTLLIIACASSGLSMAATNDEQSLPICDLHIFVHGTYGSYFSFLSYPNVRKDIVEGTTYLAVQRAMRDTEWVRYNRFMDGPGMCEVTPGVDLPKNHTARYVIGAFAAIQREVSPNDTHEHRYFLFGWNGLLSQRERRREAIRLYNELVHLVTLVRAAGKRPVLHVYGHSHGCNVMLNLGLVDACSFDLNSLFEYIEPDVVACMKKLLSGGAVQDLKEMLKQNFTDDIPAWYQKPTVRLSEIADLVIFGVPIQPETAPLVISPLFKRVLQVYSDNDGVPDKDPVSSRVAAKVLFDEAIIKNHSNIKIVRWMHDRLSTDLCEQCEQQKTAKKSRFERFKNFNPARIKRLRDGGGNPDCHHPMDPTHADFWSIGKKRGGAFFEQVPLVVFVSLLNALVDAAGDAQQLDFCLLGEGEQAIAGLFIKNPDAEPKLIAGSTVSLAPIEWARDGVQQILNVRKRLEIGVTFKSPFFENFSFVKRG